MKQENKPNSSVLTEENPSKKEPLTQWEQNLPEHLSQVNFLALESLENSFEDQITYHCYQKAIKENRHLFEGKYVLHLTEGVNFLYSFFAAEAGSAKVFCVLTGKGQREEQNIFMIREVIKQNKLEDIIQVCSWHQFNVEVDIIVAEPMGYCLHLDGIADRLIEARDMFLTPKGHIFPNKLTFKCAVIHDEHFYDHKIEYWNNVYGLSMTSMKKWISHQPIIRVVDPTLIVSKVNKLVTFDLQTIRYEEIVAFNRVLQIELLGDCQANGICFWFEASFQHTIEKQQIKASPWVDSTKFTQATLYWPEVISYKGGKIRLRFKAEKHPKQGFSTITADVDGCKYHYSFS